MTKHFYLFVWSMLTHKAENLMNISLQGHHPSITTYRPLFCCLHLFVYQMLLLYFREIVTFIIIWSQTNGLYYVRTAVS